MTFRALCEMPGCKRASYKTVRFAHGAENWFCKRCYDWVTTAEMKEAANEIPAQAGDAHGAHSPKHEG